MEYTDRERALLEGWPTVTEEDLAQMNDLFPHYLFFRRAGDLMGVSGVKLWASCCGHKEARPYLTREMESDHWSLLDLGHKYKLTCPWCGREVTAIDLSKAKGRKGLRHYELTVVLHARGEALYADALVLRKDYADEAALTARPEAMCSSGYYFARGEVMQADHQFPGTKDRPFITWERGRLGCQKLVQEPFKSGSISWYSHDSYSILNREVLKESPFFRYCGFFDRWEYRPGGGERICVSVPLFYLLPDCLCDLPPTDRDAVQGGNMGAHSRSGMGAKKERGGHVLGEGRPPAGLRRGQAGAALDHGGPPAYGVSGGAKLCGKDLGKDLGPGLLRRFLQPVGSAPLVHGGAAVPQVLPAGADAVSALSGPDV